MEAPIINNNTEQEKPFLNTPSERSKAFILYHADNLPDLFYGIDDVEEYLENLNDYEIKKLKRNVEIELQLMNEHKQKNKPTSLNESKKIKLSENNSYDFTKQVKDMFKSLDLYVVNGQMDRYAGVYKTKNDKGREITFGFENIDDDSPLMKFTVNGKNYKMIIPRSTITSYIINKIRPLINPNEAHNIKIKENNSNNDYIDIPKIDKSDFMKNREIKLDDQIIKLAFLRNPDYYMARYYELDTNEYTGVYGSANYEDVVYNISDEFFREKNTDKSTESNITEDKNPCWKGYKQVGMKTKNGKEVPNCVPIEEKVIKENNNLDLENEMINYLKNQYDSEFDEFSAYEAIYWFAYNYHGGQFSKLYKILSMSKYKPSRFINSIEDTDMTSQMYYEDLVDQFESKKIKISEVKKIVNKLIKESTDHLYK